MITSIIVVDAKEELANLIRSSLGCFGLPSISIANTQIVLKHRDEYHAGYSLVLVYFKKSSGNGIPLAKGIMRYNPSIKIILITTLHKVQDTILINMKMQGFSKIIQRLVKLIELPKLVTNSHIAP